MPRPPLFPVLRLGALTVFFACLLLARPRVSTPATSEPRPDAVWAVDVDGMPAGSLRLGEKALGPLDGQKRPPCAPRIEREVAGACWQPHLEKPPCPPGLYEGEGMCLVPVRKAQPRTSFDP